MLLHIKTLRCTVRAFLINSIKLRFLMLKLRKTVIVLARYGSRLNEKLPFKRQNGQIYIAVEFALLQKITENVQKSIAVDLNGPSWKTVRYGHDRRINSETLLFFFNIFFSYNDYKNIAAKIQISPEI
jgi:hypothetical protein